MLEIVAENDLETVGWFEAKMYLVNLSLVVFTGLQWWSHKNMMMRWYAEHPKDGHGVARSISVGLPPDDQED